MMKLASIPILIAFIVTLPGFLHAQDRQLKGKVVGSAMKEPLQGVTVRIRGSNTGTTTQPDGTFSLTVHDTVTLVFSFVGFESQEFPVRSTDSVINVSMRAANKSLDEVVVIGYGTQRRKDVTSAVASVKAEDFNQGGARNAMDLVQGKVAGLTITRTGGSNPNTGVSIQLRSATSVSGANGPLIVVDGIPGGNLDLLQQDDIASIDVLKDGSAAAIYGTQANGGVVLVTTKRGRKGPTRFDYSTYFRKEFISRKPDVLSASDYRAKVASGLYPKLTNTYITDPYTANTDMYDSITNHENLSQYHNLAMSGGSDDFSYRASVYYSRLEGIAIANGRTQYGARLALNGKGLNGRLTTQIDLVTNYNKANLNGGGQWESALARIPTLPIHDSTGHYYFSKLSSNPVADMAQSFNTRDQATNSADAKFDLELIKGLKASIFGSVMRDSRNDDQYQQLLSAASQNNDQYPGGGYAYKGSTVITDYTVTPTLEYNRNLGSDHHLSALAGYNYQYHVESDDHMDNRGFFNDVTTNNNIGIGQALADGKANEYSYKADNRLIAFFGRVTYNFQERYFLQASLRHEGSSKFGVNHKWGNFPAVSAGWDLTKEGFMRDVSFVSNLKLRGGWGITGNSGIDPYQSLVTLSTGGQYGYPDGVFRQTYGPANNPNPDLKWEKKAEANIGVDFTMLHSRLSGSIDVFRRRTSDLLYNYNTQLPPFVQSSIFTNVGVFVSKGIELTLTGSVVQSKDFRWRMDATASTTNNRMESFSNSIYKLSHLDVGGIGGPGALGNALRIDEGGAIGNFYGKRYAGLDSAGHWLFYKADGKTKVSLGEVGESDKAILGNAIPKLYLSWTNSFVYKDFDLRIFFRGRFGYKILNTLDMDYGNLSTLPGNVLKSAFTKYAAINDTYQYSNYYLQPGGFLKLDNVTLGYTFRLHSDYIRNLRVYFSGNNLAIFTKYKGNDPDFVEDTGLTPGIDGQGAYPSTRQFLFGLNLGF